MNGKFDRAVDLPLVSARRINSALIGADRQVSLTRDWQRREILARPAASFEATTSSRDATTAVRLFSPAVAHQPPSHRDRDRLGSSFDA
jgi:hypothetical protein